MVHRGFQCGLQGAVWALASEKLLEARVAWGDTLTWPVLKMPGQMVPVRCDCQRCRYLVTQKIAFLPSKGHCPAFLSPGTALHRAGREPAVVPRSLTS